VSNQQTGRRETSYNLATCTLHPSLERASLPRESLTLTHEEIAQIIGALRETVTRLLGDFKHKQMIHIKGSTLIVRNKATLLKMVSS
jgi:CRP-like cAMP-binding protein